MTTDPLARAAPSGRLDAECGDNPLSAVAALTWTWTLAGYGPVLGSSRWVNALNMDRSHLLHHALADLAEGLEPRDG